MPGSDVVDLSFAVPCEVVAMFWLSGAVLKMWKAVFEPHRGCTTGAAAPHCLGGGGGGTAHGFIQPAQLEFIKCGQKVKRMVRQKLLSWTSLVSDRTPTWEIKFPKPRSAGALIRPRQA